MLVVAVHILEVALVALATFVIYRVSTLTRDFYLEPSSNGAGFDFLEPLAQDQDAKAALYVSDLASDIPVLQEPAFRESTPPSSSAIAQSDIASLLGVDVERPSAKKEKDSAATKSGKAGYTEAYIDAFLGSSTDSSSSAMGETPVSNTSISQWSDDFYSAGESKNFEQVSFQNTGEVESDEYAHMSRYERKMRSTVSAQAFAANQLLALNQQHNDLLESMPFWVCEAVSFYLIGATDFICKNNGCGVADRKHVIELVLRSNISLEPTTLRQFFDLAVARDRRGEGDDTVKLGAFAAKYWNKNQVIPKSASLELVLAELGLSDS